MQKNKFYSIGLFTFCIYFLSISWLGLALDLMIKIPDRQPNEVFDEKNPSLYL